MIVIVIAIAIANPIIIIKINKKQAEEEVEELEELDEQEKGRGAHHLQKQSKPGSGICQSTGVGLEVHQTVLQKTKKNTETEGEREELASTMYV